MKIISMFCNNERERPLFGMLSIEVKEIGIKTHKHK